MLSWFKKSEPKLPEFVAERREREPVRTVEGPIDFATVDSLFAHLYTEQASSLIDQSFVDFDSQVRQFHGANADNRADAARTALRRMREIAANCGAVALADGVSSVENALRVGDVDALSGALLKLVDLQRETRSTLMIHLAKFTARRLVNQRTKH